ncbi:hypothetical protein, partial [Methylocaldum sp. 14B]|uniref:hypothetical protein n=1 Tax=Methylocaldum sp. 14B TaxID=1912213 RepID=UPI00197B1C28
ISDDSYCLSDWSSEAAINQGKSTHTEKRLARVRALAERPGMGTPNEPAARNSENTKAQYQKKWKKPQRSEKTRTNGFPRLFD